jgi:hypothetical protein
MDESCSMTVDKQRIYYLHRGRLQVRRSNNQDRARPRDPRRSGSRCACRGDRIGTSAQEARGPLEEVVGGQQGEGGPGGPPLAGDACGLPGHHAAGAAEQQPDPGTGQVERRQVLDDRPDPAVGRPVAAGRQVPHHRVRRAARHRARQEGDGPVDEDDPQLPDGGGAAAKPAGLAK